MIQFLPRFFLKQKLAMTVNRFEVRGAAPDGSMGELIAVAQQKRMALKEKITFYSDESRSRAVFSFGARSIMDLRGAYDVLDEANQPIGYFKKDFGASLLRTTYHVEGPGYAGRGQERSQLVAILRRFSDLPFLPIHFDYTDTQGAPLLSIQRQGSVRDKYTVDVHDPRVDFRVAASLAVAMDVLLER